MIWIVDSCHLLRVQKLLGVWDKKQMASVFQKIGTNVPCLIMALSISNCGDFYLEGSKGFFPTGCDDAFYLSPGKKQVLDTTDQNFEEYLDSREDNGFSGPERTTRYLLSTTIRSLSHRRTFTERYTASPEARQKSFQLLLRMHTNRFNQRLSMLESNTLDMKDSLENMMKQHSRFSSQLETLVSVLSPTEKKDRINDLANKYTDIKKRLSQLEHKLEILIDGFTALVQELDKVKRASHLARPPQDRRETAVVAATQIPALTTAWMTSMSTSRFQRRTVIPKTMPTPRTISTTTFAQDGLSQINGSSTKQAKFLTKRIQPISKRKDIETHFTPREDNKHHSKSSKRATVPKDIANHSLTTFSDSLVTSNGMQQKRNTLTKAPLISRVADRSNRQNVTSLKHHKRGSKVNGKSIESQRTVLIRKPNQLSHFPTRAQGEKESATKFQIPPPSHTKIPKLEESAKSSKSSSITQIEVHYPSNKSSKSIKTQRNHLVASPSKKATNIKKPSRNVQTRIIHSKTRSSKQNQLDVPSHEAISPSDLRPSQPEEFTYATASSKPADKRKLHSPKPKVQMTTPRKSTQRNMSKSINILDIFMKNNRGQKTSKRPWLKQDGNLHIVLGRLAIPIKIIPDY